MGKSRNQIDQFLASASLFRALSARDLSRISASASAVDAPRGSFLFRKGDACRGLYILISGQVKLALQAPHGEEKVVELIGPGGTFGETAIFLNRPHGLIAEALMHSKLVHIPKAAVLRELDRTPGLMRGVITTLSLRLHHFLSDLEGYTLRTGIERVAGYLISVLPDEADDDAVEILLPASKGIIASKLNLTQEHFSRILRELSGEGLIRVTGRRVQIPDVARLRARCGGTR